MDIPDDSFTLNNPLPAIEIGTLEFILKVFTVQTIKQIISTCIGYKTQCNKRNFEENVMEGILGGNKISKNHEVCVFLRVMKIFTVSSSTQE